jgi:uncharacterized protein YjaG (DUF416 family)
MTDDQIKNIKLIQEEVDIVWKCVDIVIKMVEKEKVGDLEVIKGFRALQARFV